MFQRCPKCGHQPLPPDQALPAACPACGVILAKLVQPGTASPTTALRPSSRPDAGPAAAKPTTDPTHWWLRAALLAGAALWGMYLIGLDYREGEINQSFIHGPLLVFHEAGHVLFRPFGEWLSVLGGTLAQLLMPAILACALLLKNRDRFGAAIGVWLLGVSLLDVTPYVFDALQPQLVLLNGSTGEDGGHDWIYLLSSLHLLPRAQGLGMLVHTLGTGVVLGALAWAGWELKRQRA